MSFTRCVGTERLMQNLIAHVVGDVGKGSPRFNTTSLNPTHAVTCTKRCTLEKIRQGELDFTQMKDNFEGH